MRKILACMLGILLLTTCAAAQEEALTLEQLCAEHGSMVSTTDEAVTDAQIDAICTAAAAVTLGSAEQWQLTVIPDLDLVQELLPVYNEQGLIHEGNVAFIVSVTSDTSMASQHAVEDHSTMIMGGMIAQQICVAAQMQGLGFKVITDSIYESGYTLYRDNVQDEAHLIKAGMPWAEWLEQFAILKEKYYVPDPSGEEITVMNGKHVPLKNGKLQYFLADGTTVNKKKVQYVEGYMTPCVIVLVGHTQDAPRGSGIKTDSVVTRWDGSYDPYPVSYGASGQKIVGGYKK